MSLRLVGSGNSVPCLSPVTGGEAKRGMFLDVSKSTRYERAGTLVELTLCEN